MDAPGRVRLGVAGRKEQSAGTAEEQLRNIWANAIDTPTSAREALKQFVFGAGDPLVTYERDALLAQTHGATLEVVVPRSTVISEHVATMVNHNVKPWEREVVDTFVAFLWSEEV